MEDLLTRELFARNQPRIVGDLEGLKVPSGDVRKLARER
jgi:hypothetical protein